MAEAVRLKPDNAIKFYGPFDESRSTVLLLCNRSASVRVAYKMKSTRLHRFKARPATGLIEPRASARVVLYCGPFDESRHGLSAADRFTVQLKSVAPADDDAGFFWRTLTLTARADVRRCSLPVLYVSRRRHERPTAPPTPPPSLRLPGERDEPPVAVEPVDAADVSLVEPHDDDDDFDLTFTPPSDDEDDGSSCDDSRTATTDSRADDDDDD